MSSNSPQPSSDRGSLDAIITIMVLIALAVLFKHIWHGIVWAFGQYIDLLKVK